MLVTNVTEEQKLITTLSRFELENFEKLWLTQKIESDTLPTELFRNVIEYLTYNHYLLQQPYYLLQTDKLHLTIIHHIQSNQ